MKTRATWTAAILAAGLLAGCQDEPAAQGGERSSIAQDDVVDGTIAEEVGETVETPPPQTRLE